MTPEQFFADNPDALRAYQLIADAQIPPEPSFDTFADWPTDDAYRAALRGYKAAQAARRVAIRDAAAAIAREWPQSQSRWSLWFDLVKYCEGQPLQYQAVTAVFDAAREEAAVMEVSA